MQQLDALTAAYEEVIETQMQKGETLAVNKQAGKQHRLHGHITAPSLWLYLPQNQDRQP